MLGADSDSTATRRCITAACDAVVWVGRYADRAIDRYCAAGVVSIRRLVSNKHAIQLDRQPDFAFSVLACDAPRHADRRITCDTSTTRTASRLWPLSLFSACIKFIVLDVDVGRYDAGVTVAAQLADVGASADWAG